MGHSLKDRVAVQNSRAEEAVDAARYLMTACRSLGSNVVYSDGLTCNPRWAHDNVRKKLAEAQRCIERAIEAGLAIAEDECFSEDEE